MGKYGTFGCDRIGIYWGNLSVWARTHGTGDNLVSFSSISFISQLFDNPRAQFLEPISFLVKHAM